MAMVNDRDQGHRFAMSCENDLNTGAVSEQIGYQDCVQCLQNYES
jgi:hypothetical protein